MGRRAAAAAAAGEGGDAADDGTTAGAAWSLRGRAAAQRRMTAADGISVTAKIICIACYGLEWCVGGVWGVWGFVF